MLDGYEFAMSMEVRDYECDLQGIVNNGVYQNYLEHVRHVYLKRIGIDFAEYSSKGIDLVVVRAELDYKLPLISGDHFVVGLNLVRESRARFAFFQDVYREPDRKPVLKAKIVTTAINERGRPSIPKELGELLDR